ncbi:27214_t:CDS:2, partial [Dentiscutata erythropus]
VGKSQLFLRFYDGFFLPTYTITSGADYRSKDIAMDDIKIRIDTWDAVNQQHSDVIIHAKKWFEYIKQFVYEGASVILVGNKCDEVENKVITKEQGQALADEFKVKFFETSAKLDINVEEAFYTLVRDIKEILIDPYQFEQETTTKEQSKESVDDSKISNVKQTLSTLARDVKEMIIGTNQVDVSSDSIFYDDIFNSADEKSVNKDEFNSNIRINVTSTTSTTRQLEDLNIDNNRPAISQLSEFNLFDLKEFKSSIGNFANTTNNYI